MMDNGKSVYETLSKINVNEHTEKKNGLTYLSWAWAWAKVKENYPDAVYTIYENADGLFYHTDGKTAWVKTGVKIGDIEHIEYLPVMDYKNRSIPLDQITSFAVNTAIQRSLTKAVARHGLGLYIYAGEDLPEEDKTEDVKKPIDATKKKALIAMCKADGYEIGDLLSKMHVANPDLITIEQFMWANKYRDKLKAELQHGA